MRDPYAKFNTWLRSVKGAVCYEKDGKATMDNPIIEIRCTSDQYGETLSMTAKNVQIAVKVKDVERVIEEARKGRIS